MRVTLIIVVLTLSVGATGCTIMDLKQDLDQMEAEAGLPRLGRAALRQQLGGFHPIHRAQDVNAPVQENADGIAVEVDPLEGSQLDRRGEEQQTNQQVHAVTIRCPR